MTDRRLFKGGDTVTAFTGQAGIVIPEAAFSDVRNGMKEGRRPGHYFAPGCCQHPDYVVQVPVLFEDGTYDVMRAMNIRKSPDLSEKKRGHLQALMQGQSE